MIREIFQHEKLLFASLGANGFLEGIRRFMIAHQSEASAALTWLQIIIAVLTLAHIVRKYLPKKK